MFQSKRGKQNTNIADCPNYHIDDAPCVCVEGFSQHAGSHKIIHNNTNEQLKDVVKNNKLSLKDAKNSAVNAHAESYKTPQCNKRCLRAQLDAYYKKACKKKTSFRPVDSNGRDVVPRATPRQGPNI